MDTLLQDLRFALRTLRKNPGFTLTAVVTLATGIGSTTAMFAIVNGVLLRRLPVREQDRVVVVWAEDLKSQFGHVPFSYANFVAFREQSRAFENLAGIDYNGAWSVPAEIGDATTTVGAGIVVGDFLGVLGVKPLLGRTLTAEDDIVGGPRVLVISYGLWRRAFAADPYVVGKTLRITGTGYTIVGVLPQGFEYPRGADVWTTLGLVVPGWETNPTQPALDLVGRLRPGVSPAEARAEMNIALRRVVPVSGELRAVLHSFPDLIVGDVRRGILVLSAAALLVLILASVNVGGLLLVRGGARAREFAIRSALGAGQGRVVGQLLTESCVLAALGGIAGALLASWAVHVFPAIAPPELPRVDELRIDTAALAFAFIVSLFAALGCALAPARGVARGDLSQVMRTGTLSLSGSGWRRVAVVGQIGLAVLVLAGAGLLTRSLMLLSRVDLGFADEGLVFVRPNVPPDKYLDAQQVRALVYRLALRIRGLPGVVAASPVSHSPFSTIGSVNLSYTAEGQDRTAASTNPVLNFEAVVPDYFLTMGLPIHTGRGFSVQDRAGAPLVVIVSETVARHTWPGQDAIGKRLKFGPPDSPQPWRTVVGVVGSTRYRDLLDVRASVYAPDLQPPTSDGVWVPTILALRSRTPATGLVPSIRAAIHEIDPDVAVLSAESMPELLAGQLSRPRFNTSLLDVLASLALVLAVTGLYGVISTHVTQRTREVGIRMALGANATTVAREVIRHGMQLVFAGAAIGFLGALAGTRLLTSLLFGVSPVDPLTLVVVTLLLVGVALVACYLPARRAARVDPMVALRSE